MQRLHLENFRTKASYERGYYAKHGFSERPVAASFILDLRGDDAVSKTAKRILIIDNYDSFTYNLVQYLGELGVEVTVWRNDQFDLADIDALNPDGIVVSPGPCTPTEAGHSVAVIQQYGARTPVLGVCLGHQSIGAAFGAKVERAPLIMHGKTSEVSNDVAGFSAVCPKR